MLPPPRAIRVSCVSGLLVSPGSCSSGLRFLFWPPPFLKLAFFYFLGWGGLGFCLLGGLFGVFGGVGGSAVHLFQMIPVTFQSVLELFFRVSLPDVRVPLRFSERRNSPQPGEVSDGCLCTHPLPEGNPPCAFLTRILRISIAGLIFPSHPVPLPHLGFVRTLGSGPLRFVLLHGPLSPLFESRR